jgi:hypothetical protein
VEAAAEVGEEAEVVEVEEVEAAAGLPAAQEAAGQGPGV